MNLRTRITVISLAGLFTAFIAGKGIGHYTAGRKEPATSPATVDPLGGSYKGTKLRPVSVNDGDPRRVGEPGSGELVHVYLEVNGKPVSVTFEPSR